jgi:coronin-1B/1C/6
VAALDVFDLFIFCLTFQDKTLQEFADEIRKLKAMIVKHENRIRALEAEVALSKANADEDGSGGDGLNAGHPLGDDEV